MKLKHLIFVVGVLTMLLVVSSTCELEKSSDPFFGTAVLQGTVFDAVTGTSLADAVITITVRSQTISVTSDANGGYSLTGAPTNGDYLISSALTGYFTSESVIETNGGLNYQNIFMYPEGNVDDFTITVVDNFGRPIAGATVYVVADMNSPQIDVDTDLPSYQNTLPIQEGSTKYALQTVTTDANGVVTVTGATLIKGADYRIIVKDMVNAETVALDDIEDEFTAGSINMINKTVFAYNPVLVPNAISVNNEELINYGYEDAKFHNTTLVVNFKDPIEVCSDSTDHDWINTTAGSFPSMTTNDTNGNGETASAPATDPFTATLSNNNKTLTVTPAYDADPNDRDTGDNLIIYFTGIQVKVTGADYYPCTDLDDVEIRETMSDVVPVLALELTKEE